MASFTQNRVIQYKDYVPTQPVQEMAQVGAQREQALQLGIQKVDSYFQSIAGLDVARPLDKDYIQQRLGDLKQGITSSLSGDFSDARITNQIGGAASQIYKDPQVQNAVISTGAIRKGSSELEEYRKAGKGSVAQEWAFNDSVSKYISNQDPNATFSGKAKQNTEFRKHAAEAVKAATGDESIRDDAFTTDSKGNLVIADATVRKKLAGIPPARIQQILMSSLTPEDFDQMATEGRYNYSNKTDAQFAEDLQRSYQDKRDTAVGYISKLQAAKSSLKDASEINRLDQEIEGEKQRLKGLENEYNNITLSGDVEQAKAQKGTFDFINGFSNAFAYKHTSQTYEGKTPQEMMMWREDKSQDWKKFSMKFQQDADQFAITSAQKERELKAKEKEATGYGAIAVPRDQSSLPVVTAATLAETITKDEAPLIAAKAEFLSQAKANGEIPAGMSPEQYYESQKANWVANPNKVGSDKAAYFNSVYQKEREVGANKLLLEDLSKKADKEIGTTEQLIPKLAPVKLSFDGGKEYFVYSPKDFVEAIPKFAKYIKTYEGSPRTDVDYTKAKQELTPKEYALFEGNQKGDKDAHNYIQNYQKAVLSPNQALLAKRNEFINTGIQQRLTANQASLNEIPTTTPAEQKSMSGALSRLASFSEAGGGAIANSPNFDAATATLLASEPDTRYSIVVNEGSAFDPASFKIIARGVVDKKPVTVEANLTPQQKIDLFGSAMFEGDPKTKEFNSTIGEQIRKSGGNSTSINGKSFLVTKDFPNVSNYGVIGDVVKVADGKYIYKLQIVNPISGTVNATQWPSFPVSESQAIDAKNTLKDDVIFQLLNGKVPTQADLLELQNKSKQPTY